MGRLRAENNLRRSLGRTVTVPGRISEHMEFLPGMGCHMYVLLFRHHMLRPSRGEGGEHGSNRERCEHGPPHGSPFRSLTPGSSPLVNFTPAASRTTWTAADSTSPMLVSQRLTDHVLAGMSVVKHMAGTILGNSDVLVRLHHLTIVRRPARQR